MDWAEVHCSTREIYNGMESAGKRVEEQQAREWENHEGRKQTD